jgi:hypothetical protein
MELGSAYQTEGRGIALIRASGAAFTQTTRGLAGLVTRTGAGVYVVTLLNAAPAASSKASLTVKGLAGGYGTITDTSDTVKTISTFNTADAATDFDFDFSIEALS